MDWEGKSSSDDRYEEDLEDFATRLIKVRIKQGMTRKEVAKVAEIKREAYYKYEQGVNRPGSYHIVERICDGMRLEKFSADRAALFWLAGEWIERVDRMEGFPGARCRKFYGYRTLMEQIIDQLQDPKGTHMVLLKALGGYGKTELARRIATWLVDREKTFAYPVWVNLKKWEYEHTLGQIQSVYRPVKPVFLNVLSYLKNRLMCHTEAEAKSLLQQKPILIVIDNLESFPEMERGILLNTIHEWLGNGPSRAIITSRYQLIAPYLYQPNFTGLGLEITRSFLMEEALARLAPSSDLVHASEGQVKEIWEMTRGMPLALHLVVGQCSQYELKRVITNLREARAEGPDNGFYTFLFRQAWQEIGTAARGLLAFIGTTSLTPQTRLQLEGVNLKEGFALQGHNLDQALAELSRWYLVDMVQMPGGQSAKSAYDLHPLVRFFVESSEIQAQWGAEFTEQKLHQEATRKHQEILDAVLGEVEW